VASGVLCAPVLIFQSPHLSVAMGRDAPAACLWGPTAATEGGKEPAQNPTSCLHSLPFICSMTVAEGLGQGGWGWGPLLPEEVFSESPSLWSFQGQNRALCSI
jgi:hypothetical protein